MEENWFEQLKYIFRKFVKRERGMMRDSGKTLFSKFHSQIALAFSQDKSKRQNCRDLTKGL